MYNRVMKLILLVSALTSAVVVPAHSASSSISALFKRVSSYLNTPAVKRSPRQAAVAAVRGGIPTDQGENLYLRLLDRARPLRESLNCQDASVRDEAALRPIYEALAASQFVQALSIVGAPEARREAAAALEAWAKAPRAPSLPDAVIALLSGPAARIDDKELVKAGWGGYTRLLTNLPASMRAATPGWTAGEDAAKLDETLKSLMDSLDGKKLEPEDEARAHLLVGQVYAALAQAALKGRAPAATTASLAPSAAYSDGAAAAEAAVPFEPKAIYQKASKSVVLILCSASSGSGELGTGSVVDVGRRRILTNAHVVIQDSTRKPWSRINVYFKPAKLTGDTQRDLVSPVEGKVIAWDPALDLALVEVAGLPAATSAIALAHPDTVSVGDRVAAIGHPEQGGLWTLTTGVISTLQSNLGGVKGKDAFQTDTSINRGNSGGPLLDSSGRLVGVNTSMSRKAADGLAITAVNFAVRSNVARRWMSGQSENLAYGGAGAIKTPTALLASIPEPVPSAMVAAAQASAPSPGPKPMMITESKPFSADSVIEAEISKMEELGNEMHDEINRRRNK